MGGGGAPCAAGSLPQRFAPTLIPRRGVSVVGMGPTRMAIRLLGGAISAMAVFVHASVALPLPEGLSPLRPLRTLWTKRPGCNKIP